MKRPNPEYGTLFLLKNKETGKFIFNYRYTFDCNGNSASSQIHKAIFNKYEHAADVARNISEEYGTDIDIVAIDSPNWP